MSDQPYNLGLCYAAKRLYYAVGGSGVIHHLGAVDFNFPVSNVLRDGNEENFAGLRNAVHKIVQDHNAGLTRIVTAPADECWTMLPKSVYDQPEERDAYLDILMYGYSRNELHPFWFDITNHDYKLLVVRTKYAMQGYDKLTELNKKAEFCSDFEVGNYWSSHSANKSSFLTISCMGGLISVSSYLLGKLRATTYFRYDDLSDLPYLWLHCRKTLSWMDGMHDEILIYGHECEKVTDQLRPYLKNGELRIMNSFPQMKLESEQQHFSFEISEAFPAIMLAAN